VLKGWQGGFGSVVAVLALIGLVVADVTDGALRRWWTGHALTTDTVAGVLVLLVTVLVVNQVLRRRQIRDRSRAIAAQAVILMGQAARSYRALSAALDGSGDRSTASDEVRTYMIMLLMGAPVLIDAKVSRDFLEDAQRLGAEITRTLTSMGKAPGSRAGASAGLDDAVARLRAASVPLLRILNPEELRAVGDVDGSADPAAATEPGS
jgi:hypothetical protein